METVRCDPLLVPFIKATRETEAQRHLEQLFEQHIRPRIQMVLKSKLGGNFGTSGGVETHHQADREDLFGEISAQLLRRLHEARVNAEATPIQSVLDFVAVTSYNAVNMYLRKRYPKRHSLSNKMRYLFENRSGLAIWRGENNDEVCGFAVWREQRRKAEQSSRLGQALDDTRRWAQSTLKRESAQTMDPARLVQALLQEIGHPVRVDDLVRIMAELWEVKDLPMEPPPDDDRLGEVASAHTSASLEQEIVSGMDMRRYWEMVRRLPAYQGAALLLQAHDPDGNSLIELLEMHGVASLRDIAAVINLRPEELAALLNDLPMNDGQIAKRLEVTPQHVARLRMLARRRLSEQIGTFNQ